jgi:hypothetical protein
LVRVSVNAVRVATDYSLVNALAGTMKAVFPSVYIIDIGQSNSLVVGTKQPTKLENFAANAAALRNPLLRAVADSSLGHIREHTATTPVFTDDKAPVEQIAHRLILHYFR